MFTFEKEPADELRHRWYICFVSRNNNLKKKLFQLKLEWSREERGSWTRNKQQCHEQVSKFLCVCVSVCLCVCVSVCLSTTKNTNPRPSFHVQGCRVSKCHGRPLSTAGVQRHLNQTNIRTLYTYHFLYFVYISLSVCITLYTVSKLKFSKYFLTNSNVQAEADEVLHHLASDYRLMLG